MPCLPRAAVADAEDAAFHASVWLFPPEATYSECAKYYIRLRAHVGNVTNFLSLDAIPKMGNHDDSCLKTHRISCLDSVVFQLKIVHFCSELYS
jgi:hypothetical protein